MMEVEQSARPVWPREEFSRQQASWAALAREALAVSVEAHSPEEPALLRVE